MKNRDLYENIYLHPAHGHPLFWPPSAPCAALYLEPRATHPKYFNFLSALPNSSFRHPSLPLGTVSIGAGMIFLWMEPPTSPHNSEFLSYMSSGAPDKLIRVIWECRENYYRQKINKGQTSKEISVGDIPEAGTGTRRLNPPPALIRGGFLSA